MKVNQDRSNCSHSDLEWDRSGGGGNQEVLEPEAQLGALWDLPLTENQNQGVNRQRFTLK